MQNWPAWAKGAMVDLLCPMSYYTDTGVVGRLTRQNRAATPGIALMVGLGPYMKIAPEQLVNQVAATRLEGADGQVMFAIEGMSDEQGEFLRRGPYRTRAKVPAKK
jgi:hypothetical protein